MVLIHGEIGHEVRWKSLPHSGCRIEFPGRESSAAWKILIEEAKEEAGFLGQEVEPMFNALYRGWVREAQHTKPEI